MLILNWRLINEPVFMPVMVTSPKLGKRCKLCTFHDDCIVNKGRASFKVIMRLIIAYFSCHLGKKGLFHLSVIGWANNVMCMLLQYLKFDDSTEDTVDSAMTEESLTHTVVGSSRPAHADVLFRHACMREGFSSNLRMVKHHVCWQPLYKWNILENTYQTKKNKIEVLQHCEYQYY